MNTFLKLLGAAGLVASLFATPASAAISENHFIAGHVRLAAAIEANGVDFVIDHPLCKEYSGVDGFYNGAVLAVCLHPRSNGEWTANDYDTLRHEAQHMIQDCIGDGRPDFVFTGSSTVFDDVEAAALGLGLSYEDIDHIRKVYAHLDEKGIRHEIEAFAVAHGIDASTIADAINNLCTVK